MAPLYPKIVTRPPCSTDTSPNVSTWPNHHLEADMRNLTLVLALYLPALKRRCMRCCYPLLCTSKANGPDGISAKMLKGTALSTTRSCSICPCSLEYFLRNGNFPQWWQFPKVVTFPILYTTDRFLCYLLLAKCLSDMSISCSHSTCPQTTPLLTRITKTCSWNCSYNRRHLELQNHILIMAIRVLV